MPDLNFRIEAADAIARAASPMISFRVGVSNRGIEPIHVAALRCNIEIEPPRRPYTMAQRERLKDLFGESSRWAEAVESILWTSSSLIVPAFSGSVTCELLAPCSFDFNVAATKYFYGLQEGAAPLRFEFSGQVVFENSAGHLESAEIEGERAAFSLSAKTWIDMMDLYYPASMWLRLPRETFERLNQYKIDTGIPTWEDVFERLVPAAQEVVN